MSGPSRVPRARRQRGRRRRSLIVLGSLVLAFAAVVPPSAADAPPFTIDGVVPGPGGVPEAGVQTLKDTVSPFDGTDAFGNVKELGPKNASSTKIGVIHNAGLPMLEKTNPNAQVDLRNAWLGLKRDTTTQHDWLYFGWERDSNSGSGFIAFEFMKDPMPTACTTGSATEAALVQGCNPWANRQAGDFLILWDQSGSSTQLLKRVWSGTKPNLVLGAATPVSASAAKFSGDLFRGEAQLDVTHEFYNDVPGCRTIANVIPSTVTGNSDTADYKDTIIKAIQPLTPCTATLTTTPKKGDGSAIPDVNGVPTLSIGTGVVAVKDSATISLTGGTAPASGSISFFLCKVSSGPCPDGQGVALGTTGLSGDFPQTVQSPPAYLTSAGRYCWRSSWPGNPGLGIGGATENSLNECFVVSPAQPTLATDASDDVVIGGQVTDTATLSGTATKPTANIIETSPPANLTPADGTLTFTLYGAACTPVAGVQPVTKPVSGDGSHTSPAITPASVGTYHWVASYNGSSPNTLGASHNTQCDQASETVHVTDVPSTIATAQTWVPNDAATVTASAGGTPTGKVTFTLYDQAGCTGTVVYTTEVAVDGDGKAATDNTTAVSASGSYSWRVSYDSTNPAQRDIGTSCEEATTVTIDNGDPVSSP